MRIAAVLLLVACGHSPEPAPIGNQSIGPPPVGLATIDVPTFTRLVDGDDWSRIIDPRLGVIELRAVPPTRDNIPNEFLAARKCGADAAATAAATATALGRRLRDRPSDYEVVCRSIDGVVHCYQLGIVEYEPSYGFRFERHDSGFVLTGISTSDVGSAEPTADATENSHTAEQARAAGCKDP